MIAASTLLRTEKLDCHPHWGHPAVACAHGKGIYDNLAIPGGNEWGTGEVVLQVQGRGLSPIRFKASRGTHSARDGERCNQGQRGRDYRYKFQFSPCHNWAPRLEQMECLRCTRTTSDRYVLLEEVLSLSLNFRGDSMEPNSIGLGLKHFSKNCPYRMCGNSLRRCSMTFS